MNRPTLALLAVLLAARSGALPPVEAATRDAFDWSEGDHLPAVGDQGISSTCVAWAVRTVAAFYRYRDVTEFRSPCPDAGPAVPPRRANPFVNGSKSPELPPSPTFIYNARLRKRYETDRVTDPFEKWVKDHPVLLWPGLEPILSTLLTFGSPPESDAPFTMDWAARSSGAHRKLATTTFPEWVRAIGNTVEIGMIGRSFKQRVVALERALCDGPVIALIHVHSDFNRCAFTAADYVRSKDAKYVGAHAVVIVGFQRNRVDTSGAAFRIMNSWGTEWGDHGCTWISAQQLLWCDAEFSHPLAYELWKCAISTDTLRQSLAVPKKFEDPMDRGWVGDGPRGCRQLPNRPRDGKRPPAGHPVLLKAVAGAHETLYAPAIPLVPALADATVSYFVDDVPAESGDFKPKGFDLRFFGHDRRPLRRGESPGAPAGRPTPAGGDSGDPLPGLDGHPATNADCSPNALLASDVGPDPTAVGARVERAVFEITNPDHPSLKDGLVVEVRIEVRYPGDHGPRDVEIYSVRIER